MTDAACEHERFESQVDVARLTEVDGGPIVGFSLDLKVRCADCGMQFCFRGLPLGVSQLAPTGSLDATTATLPIHPEDDPTAGLGLLGFAVNIIEGDQA